MKNIYSILFFLVFGFGNAQNPTDLIESFNLNGLPSNYYYYKNNPENGSKPKVAVQPDGKILVNSGNGLERIDNNVKDLSFNTGTGFSSSYSWLQYTVDLIVVQPDGKVLIGGTNFLQYNGTAINSLIRVNPNGSLDTSFNVSEVWDLVIQPNGKILVLGRSNLTTALMFRLESDGTLDASFNSSNTVEAHNIELQADGKLLVSKNYSGFSKIKRFNSDGSLDVTFNTGTGFASTDTIDAVTTQSDGKILLGGNFTTYNDIAVEDLIRLNVDGTRDSTFSLGGVGLNSIKSITVDSQDRLLVGTDNNIGIILTPSSGNLIRLNANGGFDSSFVISSRVDGYCYPNSVFNGTALQPDGKILVWKNEECSSLSFKYQGVGRLNADGTIDHTFNTGGGFNDNVNVFAVQPDNKILIGGDFTVFKGQTRNHLVRLNPDYTVDESFDIGEGFDGAVRAIAIQPDGKILVGGEFSKYKGLYAKGLLRLNVDGSQDTSLPTSLSFGFSGSVRSIHLYSDGKMLIGGAFSEYKDGAGGISYCDDIVRLQNNGIVDTSFYSGVYGFDGAVNVIKVHPNGGILVGGSFNSFRQAYSPYFIILDATGAVTNSNSVPNSTALRFVTSEVYDLTYNNTMTQLFFGTRTGLVKSGGLDWYYTNFNGSVNTVAVQPDDKILVGGNFTKFNNQIFTNRIARLNTDGSLDVDFDCRNAFNRTVNVIKLQSDGRILAGGNFTDYKGVNAKKMAILKGDVFYNVSGNNKLDLNNNGCDAADLVFPYLKFRISNGQTQIPNSSGDYSYSLSPGNNTITPVLENPTYFSVSPSNVTVDFPAQGNSFVQNFCITPNGVHSDVEVVLLPIAPARPGFNATYKLIYKNKGNQTESGTINLTFNDAVLDYLYGSPAVSNNATGSISWNFTNLKPFVTKEITFALKLNSPTETPPLVGGSILNYVVNITSQQTDETPNDNTFTLNQTVVNSYDPNDKTCLQGTTVGLDKVDEYVHYVIRFENTGTYAAQTVIIRDFIDTNKFDVNTLIPVKGSHLFTTKILEGNKVEFVFQNINLSSVVGSNTGYVAFKIKTKSTLVTGDTFSNGAGIYFDYNSAITTNTYTTTIQALSTQDFSFANYFTLFPNPVSDVLNITKKEDIEIASIQIYNVMGQLMMVIPNAKNTTIDVSNLASGNYFVKINSDKGTSNTKFIKK